MNYTGSYKRSYDNAFGPIVPYSMPYKRRSVSRNYSYARPVPSYARPPRVYRRRRNKFSVLNTRTNPVYPKPEVKYNDVSIGTISAPKAINVDAEIYTLNSLPQGTNNGERIGQQIAMKSCYYQLVINVAVTTPRPTVVRHILFWDRQSNGASVAATDLLSGTPYVTSPLNLGNRDRFVVLSDDRIALSPNGDQVRFLTDFRKINQLTTYPSTPDNDPITGALHVLLVSDEPATIPFDTNPSYYGTWRIRYIDN